MSIGGVFCNSMHFILIYALIFTQFTNLSQVQQNISIADTCIKLSKACDDTVIMLIIHHSWKYSCGFVMVSVGTTPSSCAIAYRPRVRWAAQLNIIDVWNGQIATL